MLEVRKLITENWLSKKPSESAYYWTAGMVAALLIGSHLFLTGWFGASDFMAANWDKVFLKHEYWRLWTTLFAHANVEHAISNLILFIPFAYYLNGYFGSWFFPMLGFFIGGLINALTLSTMPHAVYLIGASGVVHWMGAAWIALYVLLETKEKMRVRVLKAIGVALILFIPDSIKEEVSYLTHFFGFVSGIFSALFFYYLNRSKFRAAEKTHYIFDFDEVESQNVS